MDKVPCQYCATMTAMTSTKLCDNCWEVTRRLERFVQHRTGRVWVRLLLERYTEEGGKQ